MIVDETITFLSPTFFSRDCTGFRFLVYLFLLLCTEIGRQYYDIVRDNVNILLSKKQIKFAH